MLAALESFATNGANVIPLLFLRRRGHVEWRKHRDGVGVSRSALDHGRMVG